ncbi:MAG: PSD1 domain-containing protein [Planctomycetes bacterium]|nr:PSD1 domain-containing protein [Planctomycetota bacterium]
MPSPQHRQGRLSVGRRATRAAHALPLLLVTLLGAAPLADEALTDANDGGAPAASPESAGEVRYGRDVRPILSDRCLQCHGADSAARQAGLRLDQPESATAERDGVRAVVPGEPDASELLRRIASDDPDERMPPPEAKKRALSADERETLRRWIAEGARYEPHWAFVAPVRPEPPTVRDESWPRGPIDRFVLARLERQGIAPSPPADAETLLRRVFLDLTGLPPTLDEQDAWLADPSDAAYERLVDRLLGEEPYRSRSAEHLATGWLDLARYADTSGIHTDAGRQASAWRDELLSALRRNQPYDEFVVEQLAGDLLPDASTAQIVASGFNRNHVTTDEGGALADEYLVEYAVDRVNTTASVFLGLTAGCARCHDHKYDPLTQQDYYSLVAFFDSIDEPGLYSQLPDSNRAFEPFVEVPSDAQRQRLDALDARIADLGARLEQPLPGEDEQRARFLAETRARAGVDWIVPEVLAASSTEPGVTLELQADGALLVEGPHAMHEDHELLLDVPRGGLRALLLECLTPPDTGSAGPGRASHGNAVISEITLATRPRGADDDAYRDVPLRWGWSDHVQTNLDYEPGLAFDGDHATGWAADGNQAAGPRTLLLLSDAPFGDDRGAECRLVISYRSPYEQHSLGRLRVRVAPLDDLSALPVAAGRWYRCGPFGADAPDPRDAYEPRFGPEDVTRLPSAQAFGAEARAFAFAGFPDGVLDELGGDLGATYVARTLWSPDARELPVALGSDDGIQVFVNGALVHENRVDRSLTLDEDEAVLPLRAGANALVLKIVNSGGPGAFSFRAKPSAGGLDDELVSALLPDDAITDAQRAEQWLDWRRAVFSGYRELDDARSAARSERAMLAAEIPRAMVMRERAEPRETYVLVRGQYDHPDETRPAPRTTPAFLPPMDASLPRDRLGLARWLVSDDNPLTARVEANRLWQTVFGTGLVRTSEDFGLQGEPPSHPELLDWLAVELRESGWDVRAMLRAFVLSSTYRQASRARPELDEIDPENRLLARSPRRRLGAEAIRDQALYAAGLLVERFGGRSVKPYQPEGLWREVAMLQSNTRLFERGQGDDLWRRSLYTYWKRAVPPPALLTFDAPTRESCVVRRQLTSTPLQALVLWNDEQFVEAARVLAERTLHEDGDDATRLERLFRRVTARHPDAGDRALLADALDDFRARYADDAEAARALVDVGEAPTADDLAPSELAAWTMLASAVLDLHETLTQD